MTKAKSLGGEYRTRGEYHKHLDKKWKAYPIYILKMEYIRKYLDKVSKSLKIADLGCGEGVLVEEYKKKGYDIIGVDYNYSSEYVVRGDITKLKFKNDSFDLVLALDVVEHLNFDEQKKAISEIQRILKNGGKALISIPNLAHFASRVAFLLLGKLIRTSTIERHKGDRPINEYINLIKENNFKIIGRKGIFPTFPIISAATYFAPGKVVWMHRIYNKLIGIPNICIINILEIRKK